MMFSKNCASWKEDCYPLLSEKLLLDWLTNDQHRSSRDYDSDSSHNESISIFGKVKENSLLTFSRKSFLKLLKSNIFRLLRKVNNVEESAEDTLAEYQSCRKEMFKFFQFLTELLRAENVFKAICDDLIKDLLLFVKSIGSLINIIELIGYKDVSNVNTKEYHLYHLYLEIYLYFSIFLGRSIHHADHTNISKFKDLCEEYYKATLKNLIQMTYRYWSINKYHIISKSILLCQCTKSLWIALIQLSNFIEKPFWSIFSILMDYEIVVARDLKNSAAPQDFEKFKLILLSSVAPLYRVDVTGKTNSKENAHFPGNWLLLQQVMQQNKILDDKEEILHDILRTSVDLLRHWSVNIDVFNLIWDVFNKCLNKSSQVNPKEAFQNFVKIESDVMKKFRECCSVLEAPSINPVKQSAFQLFMIYLMTSLKRASDMKNEQFCSTLKGRIYSKFHKKRMEELDINGIDKFISLFATLSLCSQTNDPLRKMFSYLSLISLSKHNQTVKRHVILGFMMCLLISKKKEFKYDFLIQKINQIFVTLIQCIEKKPTSRQNQEQYQLVLELLCYYFESIEDCFTYKTLTSEELSLINCNYKRLINSAPINHFSSILRHIKSIMTLVMDQNKINEDLLNMIHENIVLPLDVCVTRGDEEENIMEVIAIFTLFNVQRTLATSNMFEELLNKYGFNPSISDVSRCIYLSVVMSAPETLSELTKIDKVKDVINLWINVSFVNQKKNPKIVLELTQKILKVLPPCNYTGSCLEISHIQKIMKVFIIGLGEKYSAFENIIDKSDFRKTVNFYFKDFVNLMDPIILKGEEESTIRLFVNICGQLLRHCSKIIYQKTKPNCLLPQILDLFVLPMKSKKTILPKIVNDLVDEYLYMYLIGLYSLDFKKDDFVGRKLREVHQKYFLNHSIKALQTNNISNPFLVAIDIERDRTSRYEYCVFTLEYVKDSLLILPQPPQNLSATLYYIKKVLEIDISSLAKKKYIDMLFLKILNCILICQDMKEKVIEEPPLIRKYSMEIIEKISIQSEESNMNELFQDLLKKFLEKNLTNYKNAVIETIRSLTTIMPNIIDAFRSELNSIVGSNTNSYTINKEVEKELYHL